MAPRVTRRHFLAAGAVASAVGLAAGARVATWWQQPAASPLVVLSARESALVQAIAEAIFPPGGTPALSGGDLPLDRFVDGILQGTPEPTRSQWRLLLHALDDQAHLTAVRGYVELPLEARTERLQAWLRADNHLLRGAVTSLVIFVAQGYCMHPDVKDACGWQFSCGFGA